jgi:hypothetical protein
LLQQSQSSDIPSIYDVLLLLKQLALTDLECF